MGMDFQSNVNILVLGFDYLSDSYVLSGDGLTENSATIKAAEINYAERSAFAVVQGQMYIFGGWNDRQMVKLLKIQKYIDFILKIAKLEECSFSKLSTRLVNEFWYGHAAIEIDNGNKGFDFFFRFFFYFY